MSHGGKLKVNEIIDYVDVIDYEIAHIINTEQMLTTESLWSKSIISPLAALVESTHFSEIKARTQNIKLHKNIELTGYETMNSNLMGLRLILSNLLSNAIKYSQDAGNVYLSVCVVEQNLVIDIRDEGMGMTPYQLSKLFVKYEKMNNDRSGQGIGLFMVKKLVDHFGGEINYQSVEEQGTHVHVILPLM